MYFTQLFAAKLDIEIAVERPTSIFVSHVVLIAVYIKTNLASLVWIVGETRAKLNFCLRSNEINAKTTISLLLVFSLRKVNASAMGRAETV